MTTKHPTMMNMKKLAKMTVHQIPFFKSLVETCRRVHSAALKMVKTRTAAVTTEPGSQWPKMGPSQLYCTRRVPTRHTISEPGVVSSDVEAEISEAGVEAGLARGSNEGL